MGKKYTTITVMEQKYKRIDPNYPDGYCVEYARMIAENKPAGLEYSHSRVNICMGGAYKTITIFYK